MQLFVCLYNLCGFRHALVSYFSSSVNHPSDFVLKQPEKFPKVVLAAGLLALVSADVSEIVGQNQYLPPNKGYNYDRPSIPFPSSPAARPTPSFPSSVRPTFQSPTPSYQPSSGYVPPLSPTRPSASRPLPGYAGYQPGTAPSGPQGTFIGTGGTGGGGGGDHDHHHHEPGMPYDFEYKVKDDYYGTDYSRNEVSDGDIIRGEYRVQLPDGRLQIVKYTADWKNGFNADVSYQGEPSFPTGSGSSQYPSAQSPNSYIPPASNSRY